MERIGVDCVGGSVMGCALNKTLKLLEKSRCSKYEHEQGLRQIPGSTVIYNGENLQILECLRCKQKFFNTVDGYMIVFEVK